MKQLTIGKRIILGFSLLILIALVLGLIAIIQMKGVGRGAKRLAQAHVPEVDLANQIERNHVDARYESQGYQYTWDESAYRSIQASLDDASEKLDRADELAQREDLPKLAAEVAGIRKRIESYESYTKQTHVVAEKVAELTESMHSNANRFIQSADFLIEQHEASLAISLKERAQKIRMTEKVLNYSNAARLKTRDSAVAGDPEILKEGIAELETVSAAITKMRSITTEASEQKVLDSLAGLLEAYVADVKKLSGELTQGLAMQNRLSEIDRAAGELVAEADRFFADQVDRMQSSIEERVAMVGWVNDVIDLGNLAQIEKYKSQSERDPSVMLSAIAHIEEMTPIFEQLELGTQTPENKAALSRVEESAWSYRDAMKGYLVASDEIKVLAKSKKKEANLALEGAQHLAILGMEDALSISEKANKNLATASSIMIVGLSVATILGLTLAILITRSITGPLNRAIRELSSGSSEAQSAANQVSIASQSLAEGSSEQAASIEETSSSMEQISSIVAQNADVAKRTSEHAREASKAAELGVASMGELRRGADAVNDSSKEMEEAMGAIKESSDSISKIIKTIDEIAFQTNILALNAAVEAARAGEAGAGFAVVADEVRSLARRAAEAAQETAGLIGDSIERSDRGVAMNQKVGENLKGVLEKAQSVESGLQTISQTVSEVATSMSGLESSVAEQRSGINEINTAVLQVNEVTQANAASAEEAASAAEEMNAQSMTLLEVVDTLSLLANGTTRASEAGVSDPEMMLSDPREADKSKFRLSA